MCGLPLWSILVPLLASEICQVNSRCFEKRMRRRSLEEHGVQNARRSTDVRDDMLIVGEAWAWWVSVVGWYPRTEGVNRTSVQPAGVSDK